MNPPFGPVAKEKRRHARKPTRQAAQLHFSDGTALPVVIQDYCQAGLYAALAAVRTPEAAIPALVGAPVTVAFSSGVQGGGAHLYRLEGWVARIAPNGVGIFVPSLPAVALEALHRASVRLSEPDAAQPDPRQALALHQECTSLFRRFLDDVMQEFFLQALERLAQAGQEQASFLERTRYDYGAQELLQARARIEEDFFNAVRNRLQSIGPLAQHDREAAVSRGSLSLVEEAEFEDWLNLSAVIRQIELDISPQLGEFEQRYSRLVGRPIDRKNNPFGPEAIGRAFQGAIQGLDFTNPMRAVLYKALGRAVSSHAPALYRQLNQVLAMLQPLQASLPRTRPESPSATAAEGEGAKPDLVEIAETLNQLYREGQAGLASTQESAGYSLDRILATLGRSPGVRTVSPAEPAAGDMQQASSAPGVLQMVDSLRQTRRRLAADEAMPRPSAAADDTGYVVSLSELLATLDKLPLSAVPKPGGGADTPTLVEQIDARIVSGEGGTKRLAPAHRQILDTASQLFGQARADFVPNSEVDSLIKRLERPLLKLALRDTRFPATPDHPARQVLNLIEQFAVAADDTGKFFDTKLQRFLYLLVDRVCNRAEEDPGVYDMVRDSLAKVLLPILQTRRGRIARMQEASEGRERIRMARARVNEALEARLGGREVAGWVLRLLDAGWRQYLVLLEMREGRSGAAWNDALAVLDRLLAAPLSGDAATALLGEIERGLATVNVDADLLAAFMDDLGARLAAPAADSARIVVPPGRLAARQGESPAQARLADRLRLGDWWSFDLEDGAVPMQLIWMSRPSYSCTFANRSATRRLDYTLDELSRQIRDGRARPARDLDLPLLDRSEQALFDASFRELAHEALHDALTGLPNRKGFMQRLQQQPAPADAGRVHMVGVIEFDQIRLIQNACGEQAMEHLIRSLAERLRALSGSQVLVAAFRDDTFALMLPDCSRPNGAARIELLLDQVRDFPFTHGAHSYRIGFHLGLAEFDPDRHAATEAVRRADAACLTAKSLGRNRIQVYEHDAVRLQQLESLMGWAGRIDRYLKGEGLFLRCQKVVPTGSGTSRKPYCEILLGVDDGAGGAVPPDQFIPAVEHLQRAHELDIWVIGAVFDWIRDNRPVFDAVGEVAINLSAHSLGSPELAGFLKTRLALGDVPADKLMFEITETAAIQSYGAAQEFIRDIRRYGCRFSLDDFGSGFTSYSHLRNLHADTLKIDGSFVRDMLQNPADYAMVKSMNDIAHSLGMTTVAEYVESPELIEALAAMGVDYVQGFAVHRPCRMDELARSLAP
ncbi:MAG: DUF1631 family protein [Pseudomonadota bacterium]